MRYRAFYRGARVEYLEKATLLRRRFYLEALVNLGLKVLETRTGLIPTAREH